MTVGELKVGDIASATDIGNGFEHLFLVLGHDDGWGRSDDKLCFFFEDMSVGFLFAGLRVKLLVRA